jgi:hypothetical protein
MKKRQGRRYSDTVDPHQRGRNDKAEATAIRYDREADAYELQLRAGTRLTVPRKLLACLPADATAEALSDVQIEPMDGLRLVGHPRHGLPPQHADRSRDGRCLSLGWLPTRINRYSSIRA